LVKDIQIKVQVDAFEAEELKAYAAAFLKFDEERIKQVQLLKRSIDARKRTLFFNLKIRVGVDETFTEVAPLVREFQSVQDKPKVHIIGAGPAGLFAALKAIELGLCPVVIERGKNVRDRRRDLAKLNKEHIVNPESNYCFGEGGAGTYSDGKLYTRSKKRGDVEAVLDTLIQFGATPEIKIDTHPHVGTNKLPGIIQDMSQQILDSGGEIWFNTKLTDLRLTNGAITQIQINSEKWVDCQHVILATGHSARDIYTLLHEKNVLLESKSFAVGVRIEHPRELIDQLQYHGRTADDVLPPASYSVVTQVEDKGVFSFCMCPGGIVAPCATSPGEVVTNGWSPSKRNNAWSNSGLVVTVDENDFGTEPLSGLEFQQSLERKAWELAGKTQKAPAQRVPDFIQYRASETLPSTSYLPGVSSVNLHEILPKAVAQRLRKALIEFGKKMKGYSSGDAVLIGVETRTSSPLRIPRDKESFMHPEVSGLYPCGEGAGFAGGIVSAAIDGERCAQAIFNNLQQTD